MKNLKANHYLPVFKQTGFFQLTKLILRNYWNNKASLFNDFFLPLLLVAILTSALKNLKLIDFYSGIILTPIISVGLISFPATFLEWKNSLLLKRLSLMGVGLKSILVIFGAFFLVLALIAFALTISYCLLFDELVVKPAANQNFWTFLQNVRISWFIAGVLQLILVMLTVGYGLTYLTNKPKNVISIGLILLLAQAFFLGCYLPMRLTFKSASVRWIGYFLPGFGPIRIVQNSFLIELDENLRAGFPRLDANWNIEFYASSDPQTLKSYPTSFSDNFFANFGVGIGWIVFSLGCASFNYQFQKK